MERLKTSQEAATLAGVTYRQLDYWTRIGLVAPAQTARGSGTARRWSPEDILALRVTKTLLGHGVPHAAILEAQERVLSSPRDFVWVQGAIVGTGDFWDLQEALDYVSETVVLNLRAVRADLEELAFVA